MHTAAQLAALHRATCSAEPALFRAPGRVNLIGEHTDYSGGFVMPAAIDFSTLIAISPRTDGRLLAHSVNFNESIDLPIDQLLSARSNSWLDYPAGVLWALREKSIPIAPGFSLTIAGDVPLGAGLSSSASIEVATAFAVLSTLNIQLPLPEIALLCQRAENAFVGANVGIMDQFVICCGREDHAVMIDTRALTYTLAPIPPQVRIVICNSMVTHSLAEGDGGYNTRRAEMEAGLHILQQHRPEIAALRDATLDDLARWGAEMKPQSLRRCRHVITEDNRVLAAVEAFQANDLTLFGELMREAHISFRDDFQASCKEIDILVDLANQQPSCFGARLTGGGFGGCTVNLVAADRAEAFTNAMREGYQSATGITPEIYTSRASAGAHAVRL
ncbi:MAG TPA: galactokinase [Acidobacteriaceae bacterium]|nr:galactokinase [Acidobacteriaceae bacterium]